MDKLRWVWPTKTDGLAHEIRSAAVRVVWNVPCALVGFQPRTALLQQLETALESGQPAVVYSLTGDPGVGKTQLAATSTPH